MNPLLALLTLGIASQNVLSIAAATKHGETVTIGAKVFQIQSAGGTVTAGRVAVNLTGSGTAAKAAKVLTFATNPADGDTFTIDGTVYTFKTALTNGGTTANEVLIGADLTASRNNAVAAATKGAGGGTLYGSATVALVNVLVTATSTNALTATAVIAGTAGNAIAIAEASTNMSWASGATTLSGGVDPTAAETITALTTAINSVDCGLRAVAITGGIFLVNNKGGQTPIACTESLLGTNNGFAAAVTYGGKAATENVPDVLYAFSPTSTDVAIGTCRIPVNFTPQAVNVNVRTSTGTPRSFGGTVTIVNGVIVLTNNATNDFTATDIVTVHASR